MFLSTHPANFFELLHKVPYRVQKYPYLDIFNISVPLVMGQLPYAANYPIPQITL